MTRDEFLTAGADLPRETVKTPKGEVTVRGLTGDEWDGYEAACVRPGADDAGGRVRANRALLARLSVVDPATGAHLFGDADVPKLAGLPVACLTPIANAAMRLSGATKEAAEDAAKN